MDTTLSRRTSICPLVLLAFTALAQLLLALWVMDRIEIATASSILLGFVLFSLLACAVRQVIAAVECENRAFGARRPTR